MDEDLSIRLRQAAGPLPVWDPRSFDRIARRPRLQFAVAACGLVISAGAVVTAVSVNERASLGMQPLTPTTSSPMGATEAEPESAAPSTDQSVAAGQIVVSPDVGPSSRAAGNWEVLGVSRQGIAGPSQIAHSQQELDRAWHDLGVDSSSPSLPPSSAALLVSIAGTCQTPDEIHGVEQIRSISSSGTFFAITVDPDCAILDRFGTVEPGPRTLLAVAVPRDATREARGVEAVTAPVSSIDWDMLDVQSNPTGYVQASGREDTAGLEWLWSDGQMTGEVPTLADGRHAWVLPVPETCQPSSSLLRVEAMGFTYPDGHGTIMLTMQFDSSCAPSAANFQSVAQSVYVVSLDTEISNTLHGPRGFLICAQRTGGSTTADTEPECLDDSIEHVDQLEGDRLVSIDPWE